MPPEIDASELRKALESCEKLWNLWQRLHRRKNAKDSALLNTDFTLALLTIYNAFNSVEIWAKLGRSPSKNS